MHILTKIFTVLTAVLAVLLVPLVVVYAHNENSFKDKYESVDGQLSVSRATLQNTEARHAAELTRLNSEISEHQGAAESFQRDLVEAQAEVRRLATEMATEKSAQQQTDATLDRLAASLQTSQTLVGNLLEEVRTVRSELIVDRRQIVELEEALRDSTSQLEVAEAARRALAEELQRVQDELATAVADLGLAVAQGFDPDREVRVGELGLPPTRDLETTVVGVSRRSGQVLVEIAAGSRDGVKEDWILTLGRGATFLGRLRITEVDINTSIGVVDLESPMRGQIQTGDKAYARRGIN